ncbi:hypothetical protein B4903_20020 [Yersinia frederiksenii]|nr:hypothetical protein B4903_20020 [Yersinia frederiksenii]
MNGHDTSKDINLSFSFISTLSAVEYIEAFSEKPIFPSTDMRSVFFTYSYRVKEDDEISTSYLKLFEYDVCSVAGKESKIKLSIKKGDKNFTQELSENYYGDADTITSLKSFMFKRYEKALPEKSK